MLQPNKCITPIGHNNKPLPRAALHSKLLQRTKTLPSGRHSTARAPTVPRCRLNTYGRRAFLIAGPTVWYSLPDELRDPACGSDSFKQFLQTILFSLYSCEQRIRGFLPARRYASAGYSDRNVSVCLSVCHAPVLCQNEES